MRQSSRLSARCWWIAGVEARQQRRVRACLEEVVGQFPVTPLIRTLGKIRLADGIESESSMPPEHPGDPRLGTALVVSAILGLVSFWGVFLVLASVAIRIGIVRLHVLVLTPADSHESLVNWGLLALSGSIAIVIGFAVFRFFMGLGQAHPPEARNR